MKRPIYEALDQHGLPYHRPAVVIGELPHHAVEAALASATQQLSRQLNSAPLRPIPYGSPVFVAFGLNRRQAKNHPEMELLLTKGDGLSLDFCPEYDCPTGRESQ